MPNIDDNLDNEMKRGGGALGPPPSVTNTDDLMIDFAEESDGGGPLSSFENHVRLDSETRTKGTRKAFRHKSAQGMYIEGITYELKSGGGEQSLELGAFTGPLKYLKVRLKQP